MTIERIEAAGNIVLGLGLSPDASLLAVCTDTHLELYDVQSRRRLQSQEAEARSPAVTREHVLWMDPEQYLLRRADLEFENCEVLLADVGLLALNRDRDRLNVRDLDGGNEVYEYPEMKKRYRVGGRAPQFGAGKSLWIWEYPSIVEFDDEGNRVSYLPMPELGGEEDEICRHTPGRYSISPNGRFVWIPHPRKTAYLFDTEKMTQLDTVYHYDDLWDEENRLSQTADAMVVADDSRLFVFRPHLKVFSLPELALEYEIEYDECQRRPRFGRLEAGLVVWTQGRSNTVFVHSARRAPKVG